MEEDAIIYKSEVIAVINKMLLFVDPRLVEHGERVAYIILEMMQHSKDPLPINGNTLLVLSILHDVGAYKTQEIDEMVSFSSKAVWSHSIYGYLFLKYMSPVGAEAEAVLYHHLDYQEYHRTDSRYLDYAALIYLADRIDILYVNSEEECDFSPIVENRGIRFHPKYVDLFLQSQPETIVKKLRDGSYRTCLAKAVEQLNLTREQAFEYLKMMVFSVDFRSEHTVTHTINTTAISTELGRRMGMSPSERKKLSLGALLHDVGKVAISGSILEFQGRLTPAEMEIMKRHVVYTRQIIEGVVDAEIVEMAARHHEKLDGSGYPEGLREEALTLSQQIIAVADIVSALVSKRSYKEAFPKQKTIDILSKMMQAGQLCPAACEIMIANFDEIMRITDTSSDPIVRVYRSMHDEYFDLNDRVQKLLRQSL